MDQDMQVRVAAFQWLTEQVQMYGVRKENGAVLSRGLRLSAKIYYMVYF